MDDGGGLSRLRHLAQDRHKIFNRYKDHGLEALTDRSRRPVRYANQLPPQVESLILSLKRDKPHWGARKVRELLVRRLAGDVDPLIKRQLLFLTELCRLVGRSRPVREFLLGIRL